MKRWASAMAGLVFALASYPGCTSGAAPAAECDTSRCLPGNECISVGGAPSACRFPCATHVDCPFNYHCVENPGGQSPYCVVNTLTFPQKPGQFGAPCSPTGGVQNNPDCDSADGFVCNGTSPLDANAYCTYFGCKASTDCGGGYYCGALNEYPNVATSMLQDGETVAACLPRGYCAPCSSDIDCAPMNDAPQHCIAGMDGATFCAPECTSDSECALDAKCTPQMNYAACTPRAGVCKGDGSLCAPCRSDADCDAGGFCVNAYNSTERFCSTKSGITCSYNSSLEIVDQCPSTTTATPTIGCATPQVDPTIPPNQCVGEVMEGGDPVPGCWTVHVSASN